MDLPDLKFPALTFGKNSVAWDLRCLLYKGGAGTKARAFNRMVCAGELGQPLAERIELARRIHASISDFLGRGGRRSTAAGRLVGIRSFLRWADATGNRLDLETVSSSYLHWTDSLLQRVRVGKGLSESSAYSLGSVVGWVLDRVLERSKPILKTSRLRKPTRGIRAVGIKAETQNLAETFAFGHFLLDVADGLSLNRVWSKLPVVIPLRGGGVLEEWSGLPKSSYKRPINPKWAYYTKRTQLRAAQVRENYSADCTLKTRYPLVNLRMQAEMHMLMGQPAVNLAQVHQLRMDQWKFKPSTHGYELRTYKHRRWGPVVFEIYSEYRKVFERYLQWRTAIFPDDPDGLLFPLVGRGRHPDTPPVFDQLRRRCQSAQIAYLSPTELRSTNVNWMLRRTNDPDLTAEEKQHTTRTLLDTYERPSHQRSMVQIKVYWAKHDPAHAAAGPGSCMGKHPEPINNIPPTATRPDCQTPAGCLFCTHQRDIDSLDHVWSLATYRLLKSFELAAHRQSELKMDEPSHPAELAIDRLTAKLAYIRASSARREEWVEEALTRMREGRYHPDWAGMIEDRPPQANAGES